MRFMPALPALGACISPWPAACAAAASWTVQMCLDCPVRAQGGPLLACSQFVSDDLVCRLSFPCARALCLPCAFSVAALLVVCDVADQASACLVFACPCSQQRQGGCAS